MSVVEAQEGAFQNSGKRHANPKNGSNTERPFLYL